MRILKKINVYYFITLFFLLISSNANFLGPDNTYWIAFFVFLLIVAGLKGELNFNNIRIIGLFSLVYMTFMVGRFLVSDLSEKFLIEDAMFLFKYIYISFLFCIILKHKAISYFVEVVIHLTVISLICYVIQLLAEDSLYNLFRSVTPAINDNEGGYYINVLFFTLHVGLHDYRNCGYMWEPGAFACILTIALIFQFFLTKFRFDRKVLILIIALVTTFSTMGYLALLVLLFLAYRYKVRKFNVLLLAIIPIIFAAFIFTPILKNKIVSVYQIDMVTLHKVMSGKHPYEHIPLITSLDRFASMLYTYKFFGDKLILGIGVNYKVILDQNYPVNVSNGIFDLLGEFGLPGLVYIFYRFAKFCFAFLLDWEMVAYCVLALLICGFSQCIFNMLPVLIFMFLPYTQVKWNTLIFKQPVVKRRIFIKEPGILN